MPSEAWVATQKIEISWQNIRRLTSMFQNNFSTFNVKLRYVETNLWQKGWQKFFETEIILTAYFLVGF